MEDSDLLYFQNMLLDQKEELLLKEMRTASELRTIEASCTDPIDMAAMHTHQTCTLQIQARDRRMLKKIGQALERIDEKEYGYCERCGEEISIERLKVRPIACHCMECKTEMENQEKIKFYSDAYPARSSA